MWSSMDSICLEWWKSDDYWTSTCIFCSPHRINGKNDMRSGSLTRNEGMYGFANLIKVGEHISAKDCALGSESMTPVVEI